MPGLLRHRPPPERAWFARVRLGAVAVFVMTSATNAYRKGLRTEVEATGEGVEAHARSRFLLLVPVLLAAAGLSLGMPRLVKQRHVPGIRVVEWHFDEGTLRLSVDHPAYAEAVRELNRSTG